MPSGCRCVNVRQELDIVGRVPGVREIVDQGRDGQWVRCQRSIGQRVGIGNVGRRALRGSVVSVGFLDQRDRRAGHRRP